MAGEVDVWAAPDAIVGLRNSTELMHYAIQHQLMELIPRG
jgi:hypothetical protein